MDLSQSFSTLLQTCTDGFVWAVQQMPVKHLYDSPPKRPEAWSVARHVFHLQFQEETVVLPTMRLWLPIEYAAYPAEKDRLAHSAEELITRYKEYENLARDEETAWLQHSGLDLLLTRFREGRAAQIALLLYFSDAAWEEPNETVWGKVTLRWVTTKTYQHTAEHTHEVLRMALFWAGLRAQE
ncbi:hypothetical protein EPA93_40915 [Ktedonosporobacter rubrisoli]|uniref:DinB family protein n=1 Tax=Ktedonosporobacter rubrisoli TaxID=2509675 RepID=A0A4P6K1N8_KTERU|nr:hypothetical protein [Ktedonosporobacter rubrisoli]QBD82004.1 hypothetical protein EPA93_40915 [Ktedonosporobacter rubrisoli]